MTYHKTLICPGCKTTIICKVDHESTVAVGAIMKETGWGAIPTSGNTVFLCEDCYKTAVTLARTLVALTGAGDMNLDALSRK